MRMNDDVRARLERVVVNLIRERWTEIQPRQQQIHAAIRFRQISPDLLQTIRQLADHTDTNWSCPTSRNEVVNYINDLNAWNEI